MDTPYGLTYGLGQAGTGLVQGMVRKPIYQAQVQGLNLQNQMRQQQVDQGQMDLAKKQAENEALSHTAQPIENPLTPHDQQIADLQEAIKNVPEGQGVLKNKLMGQAVRLAQQQHVYQLGSATQALLANDTDRAKKYLNAAGQPVEDIQTDPNTGDYLLKFEGQDQPLPMTRQGLYALSQDPEKMQALTHTLAAYDQYQGKIAQRKSEMEQKMELGNKRLNAQIDNWNNMATYHKTMGQASMIKAGASAQNAATGAKRLATDPDRSFVSWATNPNGGGMDEGQAYTMLRETRQGQALGKSSAEIAHGIVSKTWPKDAPFDPNTYNQAVQNVAKGIDAMAPPPAVAARNRLRAGQGAASGGGQIQTIKSVTAKNALPPGTKYKDRSGNLHTRGTGMGPADE